MINPVEHKWPVRVDERDCESLNTAVAKMIEFLGDIFRFVFSFTVFIGAVLLIILIAWPLWISIAAIVYIFR